MIIFQLLSKKKKKIFFAIFLLFSGFTTGYNVTRLVSRNRFEKFRKTETNYITG